MILREGGITLQDLTGVCEKNAHVFKRPTNCSSNPRSPNFSVAVKRMRIAKVGRFHFSPLHSWHPVANVEIGVRGEWIQRCLFAMGVFVRRHRENATTLVHEVSCFKLLSIDMFTFPCGHADIEKYTHACWQNLTVVCV